MPTVQLSLTGVAGCLANFHSLFLIMVWFVFIQSEASSFHNSAGLCCFWLCKSKLSGRNSFSWPVYQMKGLQWLGWAASKRHLVLEGKVSSCTGQVSHTCYYFYSVLEAPETKKKKVSSKGAYSTSRGVQLILCSLYLQYVPEVEGLETEQKALYQPTAALFQREFLLACCSSFIPGPPFYCITTL